MQERSINISSINRQILGRSRPEDFVVKFDPTMHLDTEMHHELAVDRVSMTYSWHNINAYMETKQQNIQKIMVQLGKRSISSTVCIHTTI